MLGIGRKINKHGYGREYIAKTNEFYQGEFESGLRNGKDRLINNEFEVYDTTFSRGEMLVVKTNKYIQNNTYQHMIHNFMKAKENNKPHLMILSYNNIFKMKFYIYIFKMNNWFCFILSFFNYVAYIYIKLFYCIKI